MITNIQQSANGDYLFTHCFIDNKFQTVFPVYANRRNTRLVTLQNFVIQRMELIKLFYVFRLLQEHYAFMIPPDDLWLLAMFLVVRTSLFKQFTQIFFIELNIHICRMDLTRDKDNAFSYKCIHKSSECLSCSL